MIDRFALLGFLRRPWLDPESVKTRFLALSAEVHPDRVHSGTPAEKQAAQLRYTELNTASVILREPKDRLLHLLELELGAKPEQVQVIPADLMEISLQIAQVCREIDVFLSEKAKAVSPLIQVQFFERGQAWTERLSALQEKIRSDQAELLGELKRLDEEWVARESSGAPLDRSQLGRLEELYRLLGYFGRWNNQIQERIVRISF